MYPLGTTGLRQPTASRRHQAVSEPAGPPGGERKSAKNRGKKRDQEGAWNGPGPSPKKSGGATGTSAKDVFLRIDRHAVEADFIVHMRAGAAAGAADQADRIAPLDIIPLIDQGF